jgi:hypothetical protein
VAHGEVEVEEGVLVLRRVHVVLTLRDLPPDRIGVAERAHDVFKEKCPVYRSLRPAIAITTELRTVAG